MVGIVKEWDGFPSHSPPPENMLSVEMERYKTKGGMLFPMSVVDSTAHCQQILWMLTVDVVSEHN